MRRTASILLLCLFTAAASATLPAYAPDTRVNGKLVIVGSDTMEPLLNSWVASFRKYHPQIHFDIDARGSGTAPGPLIDGESQLAPMSREMTQGELAHFEARYGYLPTHFRVAFDAVAVFVHPSNPLEGLTLRQLDGIFSSTRTCGGEPILDWHQLVPGFTPELRTGPKARIHLVGRNRLSGTFEFFRRHALCGGEFRGDYNDQDDSNSVVFAVATDPSAIGFAGIGYRTASVKMLPIARVEDGPMIGVPLLDGKMDTANISNGRYPLARFMFIYVNKPPGEALPPSVEEFLRFVLSAEGQRIVSQRWFVPITERVAVTQRRKFAPDYQRSWWQSD